MTDLGIELGELAERIEHNLSDLREQLRPHWLTVDTSELEDAARRLGDVAAQVVAVQSRENKETT